MSARSARPSPPAPARPCSHGGLFTLVLCTALHGEGCSAEAPGLGTASVRRAPTIKGLLPSEHPTRFAGAWHGLEIRGVLWRGVDALELFYDVANLGETPLGLVRFKRSAAGGALSISDDLAYRTYQDGELAISRVLLPDDDVFPTHHLFPFAAVLLPGRDTVSACTRVELPVLLRRERSEVGGGVAARRPETRLPSKPGLVDRLRLRVATIRVADLSYHGAPDLGGQWAHFPTGLRHTEWTDATQTVLDVAVPLDEPIPVLEYSYSWRAP